MTSKQDQVANLIKEDISLMLEDFGQNVANANYERVLSKHNTLGYHLIEIWFKLMSQYIPKLSYEVIIETKFQLQMCGLADEQSDTITRMINILKSGSNINAEENKFMPKLKTPDAIDLLQEQSKIRHFHIPDENGRRTDNIILAGVSIRNKKILLKEITNHANIRSSYYKNDEYYKSALPLNGLPVSKDCNEMEKSSYHKMRKIGWDPIQIVNGKPSIFYNP